MCLISEIIVGILVAAVIVCGALYWLNGGYPH